MNHTGQLCVKVLHRKVFLKSEIKVSDLKVWPFAFLPCFLFGVSKHVELLAIKCQHPSPFILINPFVLGSFPVAGSDYTLGYKKESPLEWEVRFVFRCLCEVRGYKNLLRTWVTKPSWRRESLIEQFQKHLVWKRPQKLQASKFLLYMLCHLLEIFTQSSSCILHHHGSQHKQYQLSEKEVCGLFGVPNLRLRNIPPLRYWHTPYQDSWSILPTSFCQLVHTSSSCVFLHCVCCLLPLFLSWSSPSLPVSLAHYFCLPHCFFFLSLIVCFCLSGHLLCNVCVCVYVKCVVAILKCLCHHLVLLVSCGGTGQSLFLVWCLSPWKHKSRTPMSHIDVSWKP